MEIISFVEKDSFGDDNNDDDKGDSSVETLDNDNVVGVLINVDDNNVEINSVSAVNSAKDLVIDVVSVVVVVMTLVVGADDVHLLTLSQSHGIEQPSKQF